MEPEIYYLPAFDDNYIWCLRRDARIAVVDPGDPAPVIDHLRKTGCRLSAILITHHHGDHTDGIAALLDHAPVPVYGPATEKIIGVNRPLRDRDTLPLPDLGIDLEAIEVAGHTRGHLAYYRRGTLFCGDTLFGCGCGRLFEGSAAQMHAALQRITALPTDTLIYSAHEYTASGIRFAQAVEPGNPALPGRAAAVTRTLAQGRATVPFTLAGELATNPFLRCAEPEVVASVARRLGRPPRDELEVFADLRQWRDHF